MILTNQLESLQYLSNPLNANLIKAVTQFLSRGVLDGACNTEMPHSEFTTILLPIH